LPYLKDRPLVLTRYPDGINGKSFFQKDAPEWTPAWIRTERIHADDVDRDIDYFVVDDRESLRYVVNLGTIPLHLWSSRLSSLDHPDWLVSISIPRARRSRMWSRSRARSTRSSTTWRCRAT
jgi:bifunctional non-homologous end joining protein LigD